MKTATPGGGLRVLVLEPYYGGSHRTFIEGLMRLPFRFEVMTLPARKWKWRMRLSAPYFAEIIKESGIRYDRVVCSGYVDVSALRGLAPSWVNEVPLLTYFHENQFSYPVQVEDQRDLHFALTNMTTAMASDRLAFNSGYNLSTFMDGVGGLLRRSGDVGIQDPSEEIRAKSVVLPPGIDFSEIDRAEGRAGAGPPVILWNHRWEHDKGPELFFDTLSGLAGQGLDFRVVVLGQSFRYRPAVFEEARDRLGDRLLQFGYVKSRRQYAEWLKEADIAVSTARHEFFGISVIEAARAGCRPLLPRRLSYPEIFPEEFLYEDADLARRLKDLVLGGSRLGQEEALGLTERFSWNALLPTYQSWITEAERR